MECSYNEFWNKQEHVSYNANNETGEIRVTLLTPRS
jgi:hypothetical protein